MSLLRKILAPLSALYGSITSTRNTLYDNGILKAIRFETPVIVVGNLSVGGTGKTPQVEYLIRLLQDDFKVAVLSRGYKRASKGFILAGSTVTASDIGDEPMQYHSKFKEIRVAVDADRVNGIKTLLTLENPPEVILLDDAFQHRKVDAGLNILLTPYHDLYVDDKILPAGNLREKVEGAERAQIIVVTKCPEALTEEQQFEVTKKLQAGMQQTVFFSTIQYGDSVIGNDNTINIDELTNYEIVLVTGIAKTQPLTAFLSKKNIRFKHLKYTDHYTFADIDLKTIKEAFDAIENPKKIILTTEKDYVRSFSGRNNFYYLPIKTRFIDHQEDFNKLIKKYVGENTGNNSIH